MALELQHVVVKLVRTILSAELDDAPAWLRRPGKCECAEMWPLISRIYVGLMNAELPETAPKRETRRVDAVIVRPGKPTFILEFDEKQHFNSFRRATLTHYPGDLQLGFDPASWRRRCGQKTKLEGGGFAVSRPPLFPGLNGRHKQRAFRDAIADLVPQVYGFAPTLRIAHFEVEGWVSTSNAAGQMRALLNERGVDSW